MKPIKRRKFGNTGLEVTEVSLGAMNIRLLDSEEEAKKVVHASLDAGINLIDTARVYVHEKEDGRLFESEVLVKEALCEHEKVDEPIIVVTKGHGYNPKAFDEDLNLSREKLGITQLGGLKIGEQDIKLVYFFHGLTRERFDEMKQTGVMDHALKLRDEGYFHYLGFSSHNGHEEVICEAIDTDNFQVTELPYNVFAAGFSRELETYGNIFKRAYDKGMAIINMKAFGGSSMIKNSVIFKDYYEITPTDRLRFCLSNEYIATVDAGCKYIEELETDIAASHMERIPEDECLELEKNAKRVTGILNKECRECTHCLEKFECPEGLNFPDILALHTRYELLKEFGGDIEELVGAYSLFEKDGGDCIACENCLSWCEYQLNIPELLEDTHAILGR